MKERGITLIALIITIIIMLILATVTIGAINGGLFEYAGRAKTEVEETSIKTAIGQSYVIAKRESRTNKVTEQELQKQLDKNLGKNNSKAYQTGEGFEVYIPETNRYYEVDNNGNIIAKEIIKDTKPANFYYDINGHALDGSIDYPYEINCIEDLVALANLANGVGNYIDANGNITAITSLSTFSGMNFVLTRTLNFESPASYSDLSIKWSYNSEKDAYVIDEESPTNLKEIITDKTGVGFTPISSTTSFAGTLDGQGFEIQKLYENRPSSYGGLFKNVGNTVIRNLGLTGEYIVSQGGGFVFVPGGTSFYNCYNKIKITASNNAAGFSFRGSATYINCYNDAPMISSSWAAGIHCSASSMSAKFINSFNKGIISGGTGYNARACNIFNGYQKKDFELINCCALGDILSDKNVGVLYYVYGDAVVTLNNCYFLQSIIEHNSSVVINDNANEITDLEDTLDALNTFVAAHKNDYAVPLKEWTIKNGELMFKD